jgi:hypothetical protein
MERRLTAPVETVADTIRNVPFEPLADDLGGRESGAFSVYRWSIPIAAQ